MLLIMYRYIGSLYSPAFLTPCHYESALPIANFSAAVDSAVPCSLMLDLAHTLDDVIKARVEEDPELSITLMFFDGEEAIE